MFGSALRGCLSYLVLEYLVVVSTKTIVLYPICSMTFSMGRIYFNLKRSALFHITLHDLAHLLCTIYEYAIEINVTFFFTSFLL